MAGADGIRNLELEALEVPTKLIKGNKFVKWPKSDGDDSIVATPVTLRIDPKGYLIYWQEPNKDTESLEVSCIRDTRTEKYAKIPKSERWEKALQFADPQIREVAGNTSIPLESKCLTIVYGMKFHEPCFLNFIAVEENPLDIIKLWENFLLQLSHHPLTWHISVENSIEKMHTKLKYETNQFGKIPVKKCIKMFGGNSKRAESALHSVGLMTKGKKDETIEPSDFPLIAFKKVLQLTCQRPELDKVFTQLGARRLCLSLEQTMRFVNTDQRDPRLNEILHPFLTEEQIEGIIAKYEPNIMLAKKSQLSLEGLDAYLQSDDNLPVSSAQYGLNQDMTQPISHYFVNSSHNTYLTGNQYRSRSNAEIYRQCLLVGCRCIELDCWESTNGDEPIITHGFTLCTEVLFKEVVEAINESAFKTSQYPVILSFENHVDNPHQQAKMAQYCRDIFGEKLLIDPLSEYPLECGTPLPSPRELLGKIIVKNKKQKMAGTIKKAPGEEKVAVLQHGASFDVSELDKAHLLEKRESQPDVSSSSTLPRQPRKCSAPTPTSPRPKEFEIKAPEKQLEKQEEKEEKTKENGDEDATEDSVCEDQEETKEKEDEDWEDDEDEGHLSLQEFDENMKESGTATRESKAYEAMSSLVNYIQPFRFKSFEFADKRNRSYEISSFTENGALRLITYYPIEIVNYNKRQLSRIYPKGARVDSSNYNPQLFWNAGCQLVALNFQTLGPNMQLNLGLFEFNNNCGYLLKPDVMRRKDRRQFDPFAHQTMDGVVAGSLNIKIISGQFLSSSKVSTYVEVDMYGLVADTVKKKYKTSTIYGNGTNPHYDSENFSFNKIVLPALATVRIGVMDTNGNLLGQRFLPVEGLRPGYRYITLRNEGNQPLTMPSLFIHIEVKDYIPAKLEDFASKLANPIEHIRKQEKEEEEVRGRKEALKRLLDDDEKAEMKLKSGFDFEKSANGVAAKPVIYTLGMPTEIKLPTEPSDQVHVYVGNDDDKAEDGKSPKIPKTLNLTAQPDKPKKSGMELQLEVYEPDSLEVIMKSKEFAHLQRKMEKKVTEFIKKRRDDYDTVYSCYFEKPRRPSFAVFLSRSKMDRIRNMKLPFELNMTLPPEAKKQHMLLLLRKHFEEEKSKRQNFNDDFIKNFEDLAKQKQENELKKLEKLSEGEKNSVWARKRTEKDEKLRKLSKTVSKEEQERTKKEVIDTHIKECVDELKMLASLQDQRVEKVKKEQGEILVTINDEERKRIDKIMRDYNEQLKEIDKIYDIRVVDYHRKRGHTTANISSVTYSSTNDGTNDADHISMEIQRRIKTKSTKYKTLGAKGGALENFGCTVTFPAEAYTEDTEFQMSVITDFSDSPENQIPIAPIIECGPPGKLNRPVLLEVDHWAFPSRDDIFGEVFGKESEDADWKFIAKVRIRQNRPISFSTDHFTFFKFVADCASSLLAGLTRTFFHFTLQNLVYISGVDHSLICVCCLKDYKVKNDVTETLRESGFRPLLPIPETTFAKRGGDVKVTIKCDEPDNLVIRLNEDSNVREIENVFSVNAISINGMEFRYLPFKLENGDLKTLDSVLRFRYSHTAEDDNVNHPMQIIWPIPGADPTHLTNVHNELHSYGNITTDTIMGADPAD